MVGAIFAPELHDKRILSLANGTAGAMHAATVGLVDQERWLREPKGDKAKGKDRRTYAEKESFKWEAAHERLRA